METVLLVEKMMDDNFGQAERAKLRTTRREEAIRDKVEKRKEPDERPVKETQDLQ